MGFARNSSWHTVPGGKDTEIKNVQSVLLRCFRSLIIMSKFNICLNVIYFETDEFYVINLKHGYLFSSR